MAKACVVPWRNNTRLINDFVAACERFDHVFVVINGTPVERAQLREAFNERELYGYRFIDEEYEPGYGGLIDAGLRHALMDTKASTIWVTNNDILPSGAGREWPEVPDGWLVGPTALTLNNTVNPETREQNSFPLSPVYLDGWALGANRRFWEELTAFPASAGDWYFEDVKLAMAAQQMGYMLGTVAVPAKHLGGRSTSKIPRIGDKYSQSKAEIEEVLPS